MENAYEKQIFKRFIFQKSVSDGHPGRPCSDFFKICSSHSKVHKIIFPAAYICLNGTKALLNTKNTIEKGSILVSWSISVKFGELRTTFVQILCLEKWNKKWYLSISSTLDHFSVKDFNLENFLSWAFWKNIVLWSHCGLKYFNIPLASERISFPQEWLFKHLQQTCQIFMF